MGPRGMGSLLSCAAGLHLLPLSEAAPSSVPEAWPRVQREPVCSEVACVWQAGAHVPGGHTLQAHPGLAGAGGLAGARGLATESEGRLCSMSPVGPGHVQQEEKAVSRGQAACEWFSAVFLLDCLD